MLSQQRIQVYCVCERHVLLFDSIIALYLDLMSGYEEPEPSCILYSQTIWKHLSTGITFVLPVTQTNSILGSCQEGLYAI